MAEVLLATCAALPDGDDDDAAALTDALAGRGISARWAQWTDDAERWDAPTVLRSTWDYTDRRAEFLRWVGALGRVDNPAEVVSWNCDKTYLADLQAAGVPVVPTTFVSADFADQPLNFPSTGEFVVKPSVGAGSRGAGRFTADQQQQARAHLDALSASGGTVLVQPYLEQVDTAGETALVFFDGRFSHAIRKGPMLPAGVVHPLGGRALFVEEQIRPRTPSDAERAVAEQAVAAIRARFGDLLYARVDLLPAPDGPVLVELELTEPSLFLGHSDGAAQRFADAIAARL